MINWIDKINKPVEVQSNQEGNEINVDEKNNNQSVKTDEDKKSELEIYSQRDNDLYSQYLRIVNPENNLSKSTWRIKNTGIK